MSPPIRAASFPNARVSTVATFSTTSPIARENALPGTSGWLIPAGTDTTFIQGYVDKVSVAPGEHVTLFVSARQPIGYAFSVYRLGWYQGTGARRMTWYNGLWAPNQGSWNLNDGLRGCTTCTTHAATHLVEAHWKASFTLTIGSGWLSGVYLIRLHANNNTYSYIPVIVRDDAAHTAALVNIARNTYEAYNPWGGYDFYGDAWGNFDSRATKVSFNRPNARGYGAGDLLFWDVQAIRWLERSGLDVRYTTDVDVALAPATLLQHQIFISLGHHEYWTMGLHDALATARDHDVSLAFWGANDGYWQVRYEPDAQSAANRTLVCYKVLTGASDHTMRLANDPLYPSNPHLVTSQFRDPVINEPENGLIGIMYVSMIQSGSLPDWIVSQDATDHIAGNDQMETDAGLTPGEHISGGLLGYEYDGSFKNGRQPPNLEVVASSPVVNRYGDHQTALTTLYQASSGAWVFAAGTIWWSYGLDDFFVPGCTQNRLRGNQRISNMTAAILRKMLAASPPR